MENLKKYADGDLTDKEMEGVTRDLIQAKFDEERRKKWGSLLEEEYDTHRQHSIRKLRPLVRWSLGIAASISLLLIAYFYLLAPVNNSPDQLANAFLQESKPPASENIRKGEGREEASEWYDSKQFEKAIPLFEKIIAGNAAENKDRLLLGISYVYTEEYAKATAILLDFRNNSSLEDQKYSDQLNWYLAIAYIKQGNIEQAKAELSQLQEGDWQYPKAQDWLNQLNM